CERDKQTEHPWSACQKAPSVTVTWGWGNHDLLADLGNNAWINYSCMRELCVVEIPLSMKFIYIPFIRHCWGAADYSQCIRQ
ncbi:TPA: hypothetical protein ACNUUU_003396, partial [Aeromonas salmonicida subsp. salmonicida]